MSITNFIAQGPSEIAQTWTNLKVHRINTKTLFIDDEALPYKKSDTTIQVNTYDGANNLVTSDVFSLNIHIVKFNHSVILTIPAIFHTATTVFNYFGFQLPTDFIPIAINNGLIISLLNGTTQVSKFTITTTGQVRIPRDLASTNFAISDTFSAIQQNIGYGTSN